MKFSNRIFIALLSLAISFCICADDLWAFPLDPVRIFARDVSPAAGKLEVEASIWQNGEPYAVGQ